MPRDINEPMFLKFMIENMNKEQEKRLRWFTKNMEKLKESAKLPEHFKDIRTADVRKVNLTTCLPALSEEHYNSTRHRRTKHMRDGTVLGLSSLSSSKRDQVLNSIPKPLMIPIDPEVKNILTMPLPEGGRQKYLKARNRLNPEEKFYYDQTSNSVYGWGLKESHVRCTAPKYARHYRFMKGLYSRTGPHPDPSHYQIASQDHSKCP